MPFTVLQCVNKDIIIIIIIKIQTLNMYRDSNLVLYRTSTMTNPLRATKCDSSLLLLQQYNGWVTKS